MNAPSKAEVSQVERRVLAAVYKFILESSDRNKAAGEGRRRDDPSKGVKDEQRAKTIIPKS